MKRTYITSQELKRVTEGTDPEKRVQVFYDHKEKEFFTNELDDRTSVIIYEVEHIETVAMTSKVYNGERVVQKLYNPLTGRHRRSQIIL